MRKLTGTNQRRLLAWSIALGAIAHVFGFFNFYGIQSLDNWWYDSHFRALHAFRPNDQIVIVDIDEQSLKEFGQWPWSRSTLARLNDALFEEQQVAVVGYDILFGEPSSKEGSVALTQLASLPSLPEHISQKIYTLKKSFDHDSILSKSFTGRNVVLGYYFSNDRLKKNSGDLPSSVSTTEDNLSDIYQWNSYTGNIHTIQSSAADSGYFNAITDFDGVIRSVPVLSSYDSAVFQSFALAVLRAYLGNTSLIFDQHSGRQKNSHIKLVSDRTQLLIPISKNFVANIPFQGQGGPNGGTFAYISAADVIAHRVPINALAKKIVLVGTSTPGLTDLRSTPAGTAYPGVESHANLISAFLEQRVILSDPYSPFTKSFIIIAITIALLFTASNASIINTILVSLIICMSFICDNWFLVNYNIHLQNSIIAAFTLLIYIILTVHSLLYETRTKQRLTQLFGLYVPPEIVAKMAAQADTYSLAAETREMTVLFCDIKGFTTIAEKVSPHLLQEIVTTLFTDISKVIRATDGTIDKYMGDCVMAFWGAPIYQNDHAQLAISASFRILQVINTFNQQPIIAKIGPISVGIGVSTGTMTVGDMGSDIRRSYTVIGDAVNLGARLESLCRYYGVDIIASEATKRRASAACWQELDTVRVKGKSEPVTIFTVRRSHTSLSDSDFLTQELLLWNALLSYYKSKSWSQAILVAEELHQKCPTFTPYTILFDRVKLFLKNPPPHDWDGVTDISSK